ncbi:MAG: energy transducer TonB [Terriglobales bacterium]
MVHKFAILLTLAELAFAQIPTPWPCQAAIHKSEPSSHFIRVSDNVTNNMADTKVLPDISDLKGKPVASVVVVEILVGTDGNIRCARIRQGNPDLSQRSLDAAQKWHYKPYLLNGQKVFAETWIRFSYTKDNVEVILPIK